MANSPQAIKRIRQSEKRNARNRMRKSKVRTFIKKLNATISKGDKAEAQKAQGEVQKVIDQAVSVGIFKKNTASRMKSKFMRKIAAL